MHIRGTEFAVAIGYSAESGILEAIMGMMALSEAMPLLRPEWTIITPTPP